ncbi:MAG: hypothetical protein ACFB14_14110 [Leptolyngbyaceae cyanobacterium]
MKLLSIATATISTIFISLGPTQAENTRVCFEVPDDQEGSFPVSAGERFDLELSPSYIDGENPDHRVNIRTGPGTEYSTKGIYGLVSEDVTSIGFGYDLNCQLWFKVRFPISQHEGWIHSDYVEAYYPSGLFD